MPETIIIECKCCSGLMLAAAGQKTKVCPYCGAKVDLWRTQVFAKAKNAFEASEMLRKIKSERQSNTRRPTSK